MRYNPGQTNPNIFHCQIGPLLIVASNPGVFLVVNGTELLEAFCVGVVDVLSIGCKRSRRRRSIGVGHFGWRTGQWFKGQRVTLLLSAYDRHALLWSSLPLPWDSSNCQSDKPQIFSTYFVPTFIGVWTIFISYLCHLTHPYLLSPHLIFHDSESSYSFYSYLPLCLLLGYGLCAGPALNMYVYNVWCLLLAFPDLISTWISLPPVSSTATLGLFLLITQSPDLNLSTSCVFKALRRKPAQQGFVP